MSVDFSFQHFRFHLEPRAPLHMPAYNKGNVIRGGFVGSRLAYLPAQRHACLPTGRAGRGERRDRDRAREQEMEEKTGRFRIR
jgi:hypothetical protein